MKKMLGEFKAFVLRGNVMDMAVGLIVGGMFTKIVNAVVNDLLNPIISLFTGNYSSFENMFLVLKPGENGQTVFATLAEAKEASATVLAWGDVLQLVIDFLLTALCLFLIVKGVNALRNREEKLRAALLRKKEEEVVAEESAVPAKPALTKTEELLTEIKGLLEQQRSEEK